VLPVIILFAKAPVPGRVKTRLAERLGAVAAAELHTAFVTDMLDLLGALAGAADIELHTDIETEAWPAAGIPRALQRDGDLGERMYVAMERALAAGRPKVMIVGSDVPTLPVSHLERILSSNADVTLGPAEDGGYYAIACRRVHPEMFRGVRWSGPDALEQTRKAAESCGLTVELGPSWFDVDTVVALQRLMREGVLRRHTAEWLGRNIPELE